MKTNFLFFSCLVILTSCVAKAESTPIIVLPTDESQSPDNNACVLMSSPDIEKTLGLKVAREQVSVDALPTLDGEKSPFDGADTCRVYSGSGGRSLIILMIPNHTSVNVNNPTATFTPLEWFEYQHQALQEEIGAENPKFYDLNSIGEKAYFVEETAFREIHFFKSDVEYILVTPAEQGVSSDVLVKVAEVVESQIP